MEKYLNDYGFGVLKALDEVAARYEAKPGQIALAWLIARPSVTAPIASATNLEQLAELVEAAEIELDAESIAEDRRGQQAAITGQTVRPIVPGVPIARWRAVPKPARTRRITTGIARIVATARRPLSGRLGAGQRPQD